MSLDSIVRISISTQNLQMAQAGFGTPLIIARHNLWPERVKTFSDLSELPMLNPHEPKKPGLALDSHLYRTAQALMGQNPKIPKAKIGTRLDSESVEAALMAILQEDADFYGVLLVNDHEDSPEKYMDDVLSLASSITGKRLLGGIDLEDVHLPVAPYLKNQNVRNLFSIYKSKPADFLAAAWMGKMLPLAPGSASWAFKQLDGVSKIKLKTDLVETLKLSNINRYININDAGVTLDGRVAKGEYIDIVHGIDWLHVRIQERLFRLLMINEKIPYTLKGIDLVRSEIMAQLKDAIYRGLLAPEPEPQVSTPAIEDIDPATRGQRKLPDVCFSGRLAGAIHEIEIRGTVTV